MKVIFDQHSQLPDGTMTGGMGKSEMYQDRNIRLRGVKFASKPFNKLFWKLWRVFSSYNRRRWAASRMEEADSDLDSDSDSEEFSPDPEPSVPAQKILRLFEKALEQPGWNNDKVADQFPRPSGVGASRMAPSEMESVDDRLNVNVGKRGRISESVGGSPDPGSQPLPKRAKLE